MTPTSALASSSSSPRVKPRGPVPAGSPSRSRSPSHRAQQAPSTNLQPRGSSQQHQKEMTGMLPTTLDPSVLRPTTGVAPSGRAAPVAATSPSSTTTGASASDSVPGSTTASNGGSAHSQQPLTSRLHKLLQRAPAPALEEEASDASAPSAGTFSLSSSGGSSSSGSTSILSSFFSALANGGSSSGSSSGSGASTAAAPGSSASTSSHTTGLGLSILADPELDFDLGAESRRIVSSALADAELSSSSSALLPSATLSNELPVGSIEPPGSGGGAVGSLFDPGTMTTTLPATIETSHLKKVKVYELRAEAWFDRGTGHVHGLYDEQADRALLVVTGEEVYNPAVDDAPAPAPTDGGEGGGFVREEKEWGTVDVGEGGRKGRCLMMSFIQARDIYQKQQDTLVVWTEPDGVDIALSFADADDCDNVWEFILDVQKMLDSTRADDPLAIEDALYPLGGGSSSPIAPFGGDDSPVPAHRQQKRDRGRPLLPGPRLGAMREGLEAVRAYSRTVVGKERLVEAVIKEKYLNAMILTFEEAEELESLEDLHALCEMMRAFLYTNEPHVLEFILQEDLFAGVVGMLEYDPEYPKLKASYREVLASSSNYREAVPIGSADILLKIHQTYRLQFLKDVVLARSLEDATLSIINSIIFFNQNDIISYMQSETPFLRALFRDFGSASGVSSKGLADRTSLASRFKRAGEDDDDDDDAVVPSSLPSEAEPAAAAPAWPLASEQSTEDFHRRRNVLLLLHSLLFMSKNIALTSRLQLVRTLIEHGLVSVLKWAFSPAAILPPSTGSPAIPISDPDQISNAAIEILTHVLDHDPTAVRTVILRDREAGGKKAEGQARHPTLVVEIIGLLVGTREDGSPMTGLRTQLAEGLRQLLDTGEGDSTSAISRGPVKDGPVAENFVTYFYEECIDTLMAPLAALPDYKMLGDRPLSLRPDGAQLQFALTELLSFFVENHSHRSQFYILSGSMNNRVACLLSARDKRLRHAAVRFFRACLKINTHFVHRWLTKGDVFAPIFSLLAREASADNMLCSACLELFEHVRKENIKSIIDGIMDSHGDAVRRLARRPVLKLCFEGLIARWEQNHAPPPIVAPEPPKAAEDELKRRSERAEEDYFDGSDDETATSATGPPQRKRQKTNTDNTGVSASISFTPAVSSDAGGARGLDLGYDDSDSDDDMKDAPATPATDAMELDSADTIEDVARQMSEKRRREEDDEADGGFGKLLGANGGSMKSGGHRRSGGFSAAANLSSSESLRKFSEADGSGIVAAASGGPVPVGPNRPVKPEGASETAGKPQGKLKFSLGGFRFGGSKADK